LIFISFFIQWIGRGAVCHLDSAGKGKDKNSHSQSTFTFGGIFAVIFTRRAVSRISGYEREIHHLGN
jgi:hypothetical protein